jgi:predicted dehydrogenase
VIRVAVLGAGIGAAHIAAYRALEGRYSVDVIVDRDVDRARQYVRDGCRVAANVEAALEDPEIDLVDICLPPHLHVPVALSALEANKHVICEKPIATSMSDVARLRKRLSASTGRYFPVFQYRFGPALDALRALLAEGIAGNAIAASLETHWCRTSDYYAVPWRGTWAGENGGAILGHAIHSHDLLCHLLGPVAEVAARLDTMANPIETDDTAGIVFRLSNGALATSSVTLGAASDETRIRLVYENLTATSATNPYAPALGNWQFTARDPEKQRDVDELAAEASIGRPGFEGAFLAVSDALRGDHSSAVSFEDGARSIELVTAIYAAARSKGWVRIPIGEDHELFYGWQP